MAVEVMSDWIIDESTKRRFWKFIKVDPKDGCWNWLGSIDKDGYGNFTLSKPKSHGNRVRAARASWMIYKGNIPENKQINHICDNRRCVNFYHLELGTQKDNINDKMYKQRHAHGEKIHQHKLTIEQVREIRAKYIPRIYTTRALAKEYGVWRGTIWQIVAGNHWKDDK